MDFQKDDSCSENNLNLQSNRWKNRSKVETWLALGLGVIHIDHGLKPRSQLKGPCFGNLIGYVPVLTTGILIVSDLCLAGFCFKQMTWVNCYWERIIYTLLES